MVGFSGFCPSAVEKRMVPLSGQRACAGTERNPFLCLGRTLFLEDLMGLLVLASIHIGGPMLKIWWSRQVGLVLRLELKVDMHLAASACLDPCSPHVNGALQSFFTYTAGAIHGLLLSSIMPCCSISLSCCSTSGRKCTGMLRGGTRTRVPVVGM